MKERWMRKVLVGIVLLVSALLLCACSQEKDSTKKKNEYSVLQGKKITFLTSQNKYFDEYSLMAAVVKEIYDCDVEFQVVPDDKYTAFLKLKLATTEVPDVFEYNVPMQNQEIEASKYCIDLSKERWVSRLVKPGAVKDAKDGAIYAMPKVSSSGYMAVYYNKRVLKKCGIDKPHPKTYQQFLTILETVKQKGDGVIPFYETNADAWTTQTFMNCGYSIALADRAKEIFGKLAEDKMKWTQVPEFEQILIDYANLMKAGYVNEDQASVGYKSAIDMIGTGKAAMYLTSEMCASDIMAKYPGTELGAFVIPYADKEVLPVSKSVTGLFVPKDGKQTEVAKAFLNVWSLPKIQNVYFFRQGSLAAFTDTRGGKIINCLKQLKDEYMVTGHYSYPMNDQMPEYNAVFEKMWKEYGLVLSEEQTPKEALINVQNRFELYRETRR